MALQQKGNVTLDRVSFEERKHIQVEIFDELYVSIRKLSEKSDLSEHCVDQQLTTRIMPGIMRTLISWILSKQPQYVSDH